MFFERFREAYARLPAGLIRPGTACTRAAIDAVEIALDRRLPASFVSFLCSFDGADLFHETVIVAGVGPNAALRLLDMNARPSSIPEPLFAEATGGDRFAFRADGGVVRIRSGSEERWLAGGDFSTWLDGIVAYQRVLYGPDGEFSPDAFEPDGSEVIPLMVLRQTERALRLCADSAEWHHERGVALRRLGRLGDAKDAFARAAQLDPENPWPLFDWGRAALAMGPIAAREAGIAFENAARVDRAGETAGQFWIWAARAALLAADPERLARCRREALAREPNLAAALRRARDAAREDGEPEEIAEAEALLDALERPPPTGRLRLPVVADQEVIDAATAPTPRTPRSGPRRPARATPPLSAAHRTGRRR